MGSLSKLRQGRSLLNRAFYYNFPKPLQARRFRNELHDSHGQPAGLGSSSACIDKLWSRHEGTSTFSTRSSVPPELSRKITATTQHGSHQFHTDSMYIHHTYGGSGRDSAAAILGLIHALEPLCPGIGYFRPIDSTTFGGKRSTLIHKVFQMHDRIEDMQGTTQAKAYQLLTSGQTDDLIDDILKAYEVYKARHDFVVVEGSALRGGGLTTWLNSKIAAAIGTPVLYVVDAAALQVKLDGQREGSSLNGEAAEDYGPPDRWPDLLVDNVSLNAAHFREDKVDALGVLVHSWNRSNAPEVLVELREALAALSLPLAGVIPRDPFLESIQVQDVITALGAELVHGSSLPEAMATEVTQFIIATMQLSDLLGYLPSHTSSTQGPCIITAANRADMILGMLALHESHSLANVAALVLTGGERPSMELDMLLKNRPVKDSLPVLLSPLASFETATTLSRMEGHITPSSDRKIERAQLLFAEHVDMGVLEKALSKERPVRMSPKLFASTLFSRAKADRQTIVLPEGTEPRILQAAWEAVRRGLCDVVLLGAHEAVRAAAKQLRVDLSEMRVVDPATSPDLERYAEMFYELRKHKGLTLEQARTTLSVDVNYFGTAMVAAGDAGGMVSGAVHTTANTVRPALQIIKTDPDTPVVSSVFFMCLPDKVLVYGDCAINTNPTSEELAAIALASADTAAAFGVEPRVALLSYATGDSNTGPLIQKVADAVALVKQKRPSLFVEGPIQYDAAVNEETARTKLKGKHSEVAGKATVLVFPDLNTGNNTYKAVQQSTGAVAMGPVLQGLRRPVNDLSRGCTVKDVVTTIAITAVQAAAIKNNQRGGQGEGLSAST